MADLDAALPTSASKQRATHKKTKVRGSNYVPAEDAAVAKAYIRCSENSIKGSEQRSDTFFSDVTDSYNEFFKPDEREKRSPESIKARVKLISKACTAFSGCYGRVMRLQPTGTNADDIIRLSTGLFNAHDMRNAADDYGKDFKFLDAWKVLKEHPRFSPCVCNVTGDIEAENSKAGNISTSESLAECTDALEADADVKRSVETRPIGRTRAKKEADKQRIAHEKLKVASEALDAQRQRTEAINKHYEILLFTSGPDGMDAQETAEYFTTMRKRVIANLRESQSSKRQRGSSAEGSAAERDALRPQAATDNIDRSDVM